MVRSGTTGIVTAAALLLGACGTRGGVPVAPLRPGTDLVRYEQARPAMGGSLRISIVAPDGYDAKADRAFESAFEAAARWEALLAETDGSPVARVNAQAGVAPVEVPEEVRAAFRFVVKRSGFDSIVVDEKAGTVFLPKGTVVHFSWMQRGIGADAAAVALREKGFEDFELGFANVAFFSGDAGGEAWRATLRSAEGEVGTLDVRNQAVAWLANVLVVADDASTALAVGENTQAIVGEREGRPVSELHAKMGADELLEQKLQGIVVSDAPDGGAPVMIVTKGLKDRLRTAGFGGEVVWIGGAT